MIDLLKTIAHNIWDKYSAKAGDLFPRLMVNINSQISDDQYRASFENHTIYLEVNHKKTLIYATNLLAMAIQSSSVAEVLGLHQARFSLRPLWFKCRTSVALSKNVTIALPNFILSIMQEKDRHRSIEQLAEKMFSMGFNAIVLGDWKLNQDLEYLEEQIDWKNVLQEMKSTGLKIILKVNHFKNSSHKEIEELKEIEEFFSSCDYLMWQGLSQAKDEMTLGETLYLEVQMLEKALSQEKTQLIYLFPWNAYHYFEELCDSVGEKTQIAFSACSRSLEATTGCINPIWNILRQAPDYSSTPLLPILNLGSIGEGEGLWPFLPLEFMENYFSRMKGHVFSGVLTLLNEIPKEGTPLEASLFLAGQMQWKNASPRLLAENWANARGLKFEERYLRTVQELLFRLAHMQTILPDFSLKNPDQLEVFRLEAQSLVSLLNGLRIEIEGKNVSSEYAFQEYYPYFIRDAKRLILYFLQKIKIALPQVLEGEDFEPGFWTMIRQGNANGLNRSVEVILCEEPYVDNKDSQMQTIFLANRSF